MSAQTMPRVTPEQYLEADRAATFKSEYYGGYVRAMGGGTLLHAILTASVIAELSRALAGRSCAVLSSDARLQIARRGSYVYPDATVVCGPVRYGDQVRKDILVNPTVVIEVLSESTEAHDRGAKFAHYRTVESLQEYVLVSQTAAHLEVFSRKENGKWELSEYTGLDATARLESLDAEIALARIYDKATLPPEEPPPAP